jgi:hypothetical protein
VLSINSPPFIVSGTHCCTGARTPVRPTLPPFGAGRSGRSNPCPEPMNVCASSPATRSNHPRSFWPPGTPSRAHAGGAPTRRSCLRRARRHASRACILSHWILCGRSRSKRAYPLGFGPPWTHEPGSRRGPPPPWPLDQRSTTQPGHFL